MDFGRLRIAYDGRFFGAAPLDRRPDGRPRSCRRPRRALCSSRVGAGQIGLLAVADSDRQLVRRPRPGGAADYARRNADAAATATGGGPRGSDRRDSGARTPLRRWSSPTRRSRCAETGRYPVLLANPMVGEYGRTSPGPASTPRACTSGWHAPPPASHRRAGRRRPREAARRRTERHRGALARARGAGARRPSPGRSQLLRQHLVGAVAPRQRPRLQAAADRRDRPSRAVRHPVRILDGVVAADEQRLTGQRIASGGRRGRSCHRLLSARAPSAATRSSRSSAATRAEPAGCPRTEAPRPAAADHVVQLCCSCTASASTCSA